MSGESSFGLFGGHWILISSEHLLKPTLVSFDGDGCLECSFCKAKGSVHNSAVEEL